MTLTTKFAPLGVAVWTTEEAVKRRGGDASSD